MKDRYYVELEFDGGNECWYIEFYSNHPFSTAEEARVWAQSFYDNSGQERYNPPKSAHLYACTENILTCIEQKDFDKDAVWSVITQE